MEGEFMKVKRVLKKTSKKLLERKFENSFLKSHA